jgi:hypothetical protein
MSCDFKVPLIARQMEGDQDLVGKAPSIPRRSIGIAVTGGPSVASAVVVDRVPNDTINGVRIAHQSIPHLNWRFSMITKKYCQTLNVRYIVRPVGVNLRKRGSLS